MKRGYQYSFSEKAKNASKLFHKKQRQQKAATMIKVISDAVNRNISELNVLNVGSSAGIIDEYISRYFRHVIGIDIDNTAIEYAQQKFTKGNLLFELGDAMNLKYKTDSFDVIICSQVYEHVQDASAMMDEIYRVLASNGVVYFAAGNRLVFNEPHYDLPLLSVMPRWCAHRYLSITKKGVYYYEKHLSLWGLKNLVSKFEITDYTKKIILHPSKYSAESMIMPGSKKQKFASFFVRYFIWLVPGYIWILRK